MIDTIQLRVYNDLLTKYTTDVKIRHSLHREFETKHTGIQYIGKINNLIVTKKWGDLFIKGSVAKYKNRNNIQHSGIADLCWMVDDLSEKLELPLAEAVVTRIDIGFNLPLTLPPEYYIMGITQAHGYANSRKYGQSGIAFIQTEKVLEFYNKLKEVKLSHPQLDTTLYPHLLRCELQLKSPHKHLQFNRALPVHSFYDKCLLQRLIGLWVKEYFKVYRNKIPIVPPEINTQRDFFSFISLFGADKLGGEAHLHNAIKNLNMPAAKYPAKIKVDMKNRLSELYANPHFFYENAIEEELDRAVLLAASQDCF